MQYLALTALFFGLATAAPTSLPLAARACSTAYPRSIGFPINYDIRQDAGKQNVVAPVVIFNNVPAGSYGCQLEANFPTGYPIQSSGSTSVNIFSADADGRKKFLFGTVTFASSPVAPTKFVINSAKCEPLMVYRMEIASETLPGRVQFADTIDAGITMKYNC